jgi:mycothiol synthase
MLVKGALGVAELREVLELLDAAKTADHRDPISEAPLLALRGRVPDAVHLLVREEGHLAGYAALDTDLTSGELVVAPMRRRHGLGRAMVAELRQAGGDKLRLWAHGDTNAQQAFAQALGARRVRELLLMRLRPIPAALPRPQQTAVTWKLRRFRPGLDEDAWVDLNAAAFADHPEQGAIRRDGFELRMRESWFDPAGLILAEAPPRLGGGLAGFVWTKVVGESGTKGEIYVLGVHPRFQGQGLGTTLLRAALVHLRELGAVTAILYVEGEGQARHVYERMGFETVSKDVQYAL